MTENAADSKQCPFCGEKIRAAARKCRYCGEWLEGQTRESALGDQVGGDKTTAGDLGDVRGTAVGRDPDGIYPLKMLAGTVVIFGGKHD